MIEERRLLTDEKVLTVTGRFKNGDFTDPVYKEIVHILKEKGLREKDVYIIYDGKNYPTVYRKNTPFTEKI